MRYKLLLISAIALLAMSCTKVVYVDKVVGELPSYPDLENNVCDTVRMIKAKIQYYGPYSMTVDRWYLTLYENEDVSYVHEDDEFAGKGEVVVLCLQTEAIRDYDKQQEWEKNIPVIARHYSCPDSYSDLQPGQFEFGFDYPYDHPYKGIRYATYGSYAINLDETEYIPRYAGDGAFDIELLPDGNYRVSGLLVDTGFKKHYFMYEGPVSGVTEWNYYQAPDSGLKADVSLSEVQLPKMELRRTELPFGSSKNIDVVRMYLTANGVTVGPQSSYGPEKLSGSGAVAVLELIVEHGETSIPAGTYYLAPSEDGGYSGAYLKPFHFKEGAPHRYTNREGSWYFNLADNGHWAGEYARVCGGTVTVSYAGGKTTPVIHAEFTDISSPVHKITIDWK